MTQVEDQVFHEYQIHLTFRDPDWNFAEGMGPQP